ncbi:MAG: DUF559 domain-containing protein [Mesorhizobium sp.]|nr:MAG: DUF559 domain-containing protein [Mesorhizobium sp.]
MRIERDELPPLPDGERVAGAKRRSGEGAAPTDPTKRNAGATARARKLRVNETEAEYRLWGELRGRHLNGYKFVRQVPLGPFIADFVCREKGLIVELDGSQHADSPTDPALTRPPLGSGHPLPVGERREASLMDSFRDKIVPVTSILAGVVVVWYVFAVILNAPFQRDLDRRAGETPGIVEFIGKTMSQPKPTLPAPHQVAVNFFENTFLRKVTSNRSLVYNAWVTLSSTLLGFAFGTGLGILIAVGIVHVATLDRSLMPWIIASQTIPILAVAPMIIVVLAAIGVTGLIPKALISTYLSFFPVAVGMVKGLRSPELTHLDLMHTYNASASQTFWKLRVPASVPFLFTSMKVAVAASLVGAIVGELPTGAVAGIGAKLLAGAYYSQTIDIWSALVAGSVVAALLVMVVGIAGRLVDRAMGGRPA